MSKSLLCSEFHCREHAVKKIRRLHWRLYTLLTPLENSRGTPLPVKVWCNFFSIMDSRVINSFKIIKIFLRFIQYFFQVDISQNETKWPANATIRKSEANYLHSRKLAGFCY